ncbi:MAG TPA: RHS repeat-associated core domain-containing protein [Candidatus Obscuribacterales bacterium]
MKKQKHGRNPQPAEQAPVTCRKHRQGAILGTAAVTLIVAGIGAYAANAVLQGHVTKTQRAKNFAQSAQSSKKDTSTQVVRLTSIGPNSNSDLTDQYGIPANSHVLAGALRDNEAAAAAKESSDRDEALRHGFWREGDDPIKAVMYGYVPPGWTQERAAMEYRNLPHLPKMQGPTTAEDVPRMAGEPLDPAGGLPSGMTPAAIAAQNQQLAESAIRARMGPQYLSPLHRGHNVVRESANSGTIQSEYSYDPWGNQTKISGTGPDSDFGYAGMYVHQRSGLNLTKYRAYSPSLGRWLNRDPIDDPAFGMMPSSPEPGDPKVNEMDSTWPASQLAALVQLGQGFGSNLYAYVHNNPISLTDPLGLREHYDTPVPCPVCCMKQGQPPVPPGPAGCTFRRSKEWDPMKKQWYWALFTWIPVHAQEPLMSGRHSLSTEAVAIGQAQHKFDEKRPDIAICCSWWVGIVCSPCCRQSGNNG